MCGICGEIRFDGCTADVPATVAMTAAMASRGPDGEGLWHDGPVAFGHRRLAIIDVSDTGAQPMVDDGCVIVFNGCIYNHHELRKRLTALGHQFRSTSDTEVVIKAYRHWGERLVDHLVGMFAFVLLDRFSRRVIMVRDRLGIKPLYVADVGGGVRFASSLPALLEGGGIDTSLDPVAVHHYLSWHSIVPAPRTLLHGVRKLPPATMRTIEPDGRPRDEIYWRPIFHRPTGRAPSPVEWQVRLLEALKRAVERRMVADVPVGVLLSGGLDSSLIVALLSEAGATGLPTFSIGFEHSAGIDGDEFFYSDLIARRFGTTHHRIRIPSRDIVDNLEPTVLAMSEPMASHDVIAFHLLSEQVAKHIKVVQSGQGADEVFAGYGYYQPLGNVRRQRAGAVFSREFRDASHADVLATLGGEHRVADDVSTELIERSCAEPGAETALDAALRLELTCFMPDDPVKRVDNTSMAWGLEARVPFLDHELVELAAQAPPELKLAQGGKGILKDIARPLVGSDVVDRPKGYFPVPAVSHLDGDVLDYVVDVLRSPVAKARGLIDPGYVDALLAEPERRFAGQGDRLWHLGVLEMWLQAHGIGG
ncbi:N-acetylglutaminylglutamine amidotransferase [Mycobacterium sp. URHB0044]|jgi:asparagine synthase (glutamine-hydrolysing)|uniref:N-acetylglutaminylglutamine amidotransferase n=1 Tax=Mycobacterium sp. URHB0044 TaxID=1380386 RepID=UPI000491A2AC|nr:N-acetylglutaminylglutamine amidotransferase [Mycobacterium sp. URHB0044]